VVVTLKTVPLIEDRVDNRINKITTTKKIFPESKRTSKGDVDKDSLIP